MSRNALFTTLIAIALSAPILGCRTETAEEADAATAVRGSTTKPKELIREATSYLDQLDAFACRVKMSYNIEAPSMNTSMSTVTNVRLERPNRIASIVEEGMMGSTLVCDGEQLVLYVPMLDQYTVEEAPEDLSDPASMVTGMGGMNSMLSVTYFANGEELHDQLMDSVAETEYLGQEQVDGVACHHCLFRSDEMDWEIWIEAGKEPLVRKIVPDMSKQLEQFGEMFKDADMDYLITLSDWNTNPTFTDEDFAFTPPPSAEKVDSLFSGMEADEGPHPLLGEEAPPLETVDMNEEPINLSEHLGKDVVILDFWATWCGPCVDALPKVSQVAGDFADRGVIFYAVNVREEVEEIQEFLDSIDYELPVVLDREGEISELYHANAIPQTVLIGKDGRVQVVHVGFGPRMENTLTEELEALLDGEDLASAKIEEMQQAEEARQESLESEGIEVLWSSEEGWTSVATLSGYELYAIDVQGNVAVLNAQGETQREFSLEKAGNVLRLGNLVAGGAPETLSFRSWGEAVRAYDSEGNELWDYSLGQGVNDVVAADLTDDGIDEVIVGYNGSTGLHVLDNRGTLLWKYTKIGNVWHVAAGDFTGDGQSNVLTTSAGGGLHVFDAEGNSIDDHEVSTYANMIRTAHGRGPDDTALVLLGGSGQSGEQLIAVESEGKEVWSVSLHGSDNVDSLAIAENSPWAAVGMRGGTIYVVDLEAGTIIARFAGGGLQPQVAWLATDDGPLLLVANGKSLEALKIADPQ